MKFKEKLLVAARANNSWLCVGLDPDIPRIPSQFSGDLDAVLRFNRAIIDVTSDLVCAYKPNSAFYEALGGRGWEILSETIKSVPRNIPVILDFKRGDIGNTAKKYAESAFEMLGADAVTVSPYLGRDAIEPFLQYEEKGIFVLCLTSNPSNMEIQKKIILLGNPPPAEGMTPNSKASTFAELYESSTLELYKYVARLAVGWNRNKNIGVVAGATAAMELESIREEIGEDVPILVPGVGAQGGDLEKAVMAGSNSIGEMAIVNVSRGIIYAGKEETFCKDIRGAAKTLRDDMANMLGHKV
jgi:orotidine-5'-phosphate decarboxylase